MTHEDDDGCYITPNDFPVARRSIAYHYCDVFVETFDAVDIHNDDAFEK